MKANDQPGRQSETGIVNSVDQHGRPDASQTLAQVTQHQ